MAEGFAPDQFWRVTPLEFTNIMRGCAWRREEREREALTLAWHTEAFHRQKRLPDLETVLAPPGEIAEQTSDDILHVLRSIQAGGANNMQIKTVEVPEVWRQQ